MRQQYVQRRWLHWRTVQQFGLAELSWNVHKSIPIKGGDLLGVCVLAINHAQVGAGINMDITAEWQHSSATIPYPWTFLP